jgi:predicted metal-dependent HD superfamily phosphohydrolase
MGTSAVAEQLKLEQRWEALTHDLGTDEVRADVFDQLYAAYTAPDRHYHDIRHIEHCLREFDAVRSLADNPRAIELAIWFHDVIYDGRRQDNEEKSADFGEVHLRELGAPADLCRDVRELILLTRHDRTPPTVDGKLIVDIDLSSLGIAPEAFDANGESIRREYPHVTDADFRRGRAAQLGRFLDRPLIYYTDHFRDRYERAARANLCRTLAQS